jgi:hypothetical protein
MRGHNVNIYFSEETYNKIKPLIQQRKISFFVNQAVEKQLQKEEKRVKEQLKQQLIQGYQNRTKNKNLQKTLQIYGEMSLKDLNTKLAEQEKNGQPKK